MASLKDLFTTHLEPYATEVILFSEKYVSELCIEYDKKQRFKEGFVAPACELHHWMIPSMGGHAKQSKNMFFFQKVIFYNVLRRITLF